MHLNEFAAIYPELYVMLRAEVRYMISENNMSGDESLNDWDDMVTDIVRNFNENDFADFDIDEMPVQQQLGPFDGFRDRDRDRDRDRRRRRRRRNFDIRDIIRAIFLRELFDRNRD